MKIKVVSTIIVVALLALVVWGIATPKTPSEIRFGFIAPLTGDVANLGNGAFKSATYAVDKINQNGGINGKKVVLVAEDSKCSGKDAVSAVNKLISQDKISALIGGFCSSESLAITGILDQNKIPAISPISSSPELTGKSKYFFRNYPSDSYQGVFAARLLKEKLNKTKVAVLYSNSDWGLGVKNSFVGEFKKLGGDIVAEEGYVDTVADLKTQLVKIKSTNPDEIYFVGYTNASIVGLKQMKELGISTPVFGADAWNDAKIWQETSYANNVSVMYTVPKSEAGEQYKSEIKSAGVGDVTAGSSQAYDAVNILAEAIKHSGVNGDKIKDYLKNNSFNNTVSYTETKFDSNGDLVGAQYEVYGVEGGKSVVVK